MSVSSINFNSFTCETSVCYATATYSVTKISECTFDNMVGEQPLGINDGCAPLGGTLLEAYIISQNIVGNTCTYTIKLTDPHGDYGGSNYCGVSFTDPVIWISVNGGFNCCDGSISASVSICNSTCTTCSGGGGS